VAAHEHAEPTPEAPAAAAVPNEDLPPEVPFLLVGVGGSAGSLEAFKELLGHLPPHPGLSFLFVQHLAAGTKSLMPELLAKVTSMTVRDAADGERLAPDHVYLIPPDSELAVKAGALVLTPRSTRPGPHMPIDHMLRSLADHQRGRAVAVILSGGGTDGTLGLRAVKSECGITFAQDERTARHDSMPRSAVADGWVDYVLPPAQIAEQLLRIARHPYAAPAGPRAADGVEAVLDRILGVLRGGTGVDFTHYKRTTILRRVRRRMALRGLDSAADYVRLLQDDPVEARALYHDFLIRVTRFFRDEEVFEALKGTVFPKLVEGRSPNSPLRFWVAGCSTGEEVYSLAIAALEYLGDRNLNFPVKVLATDVNEAALERARAGVYVDNIELDVSPERLRRFFAKANGHYQIGKAVRDLCVFSKHDLTSDPPFSRLDLVSCRNVLIYLEGGLQKRVLPVLHYALGPGGFLVLGSSETVGAFPGFTAVDARHRIYTKNPGAAPVDFGPYSHAAGALQRAAGPAGPAPWSAVDVQKEADRVVLARYAPVGVVVDENMTVLQFRGRTGPYLEPSPGMASLDLLKMVREGLLGEVRAAVAKAKAENVTVKHEKVPLREADHFRLVDVEVMPIKVPPAGVRCFVVLFREAPAAEGPPPPATPDSRQAAADQQVLQQELTATREYLQSLVEEHESACEELKSASEELLSSNEELQSTNEELQTAKEETQSANEELVTLNDELRHRNLELAQVNNDLVNLLAAVQVPIVLVSRDLRLRRFTPTAEKVLNLIPTDVGRPIGDIKPNLKAHDLVGPIAQVIDTLTPLEREVQDSEGRWYSLRVRPYITLDNKIDGASLALFDVDALKRRGDGPAPAQRDGGGEASGGRQPPVGPERSGPAGPVMPPGPGKA
jgi:two-component system, chemotaxis family, CheB/CheR fusion protein